MATVGSWASPGGGGGFNTGYRTVGSSQRAPSQVLTSGRALAGSGYPTQIGVHRPLSTSQGTQSSPTAVNQFRHILSGPADLLPKVLESSTMPRSALQRSPAQEFRTIKPTPTSISGYRSFRDASAAIAHSAGAQISSDAVDHFARAQIAIACFAVACRRALDAIDAVPRITCGGF